MCIGFYSCMIEITVGKLIHKLIWFCLKGHKIPHLHIIFDANTQLDIWKCYTQMNMHVLSRYVIQVILF